MGKSHLRGGSQSLLFVKAVFPETGSHPKDADRRSEQCGNRHPWGGRQQTAHLVTASASLRWGSGCTSRHTSLSTSAGPTFPPTCLGKYWARSLLTCFPGRGHTHLLPLSCVTLAGTQGTMAPAEHALLQMDTHTLPLTHLWGPEGWA